MMGVTIDKVRGNEGMQLDMRIGSRGPLHCGGAGKAMLAFISPEQQQQVYAQPLKALTPYTHHRSQGARSRDRPGARTRLFARL